MAWDKGTGKGHGAVICGKCMGKGRGTSEFDMSIWQGHGTGALGKGKGLGHVARVGTCGKGRDMWQGYGISA